MVKIEEPLDQKKERLLKVVVNQYIQTASPVASLSIEGMHGLDSSSATLRNWMSDLEQSGYLKQPHASSGRVPTDKGYRHYVDWLMKRKYLSAKERKWISKEMDKEFDEIDGMLKAAARIVSYIGGYAAVAFQFAVPTLVFKKIELVPIDAQRFLYVLVTENGFVFDRILEMDVPQDKLEFLNNFLNEHFSGIPLSQINDQFLDDLADEMLSGIIVRILRAVSQFLERESRVKILVEGTNQLLKQPEFQDIDRLKTLMEYFEQGDRFFKFFERIVSKAGLNVVIGDENPLKNFQDFSVVASPFGNDQTGYGVLALVGPTRMDYPHVVPLVEYASNLISQSLSQVLS
jgi:heat-inducible transcriptional repressor